MPIPSLPTFYRFLIPIIILLVIGGAYTFNESTTRQQQQINKEASDRTKALSLVLTATKAALDDEVKSSMALLKRRGETLGVITQTGSVKVGDVTVPNLAFGNIAQANRYELVDGVTEILGGTATIFVKFNDDFVRISTNVLSADGSRRVGTHLDREGKAIKALQQGKPFYGVVDILGKPYITGYEPMLDEQGKVIGAWYVGYEADLKSISDVVDDTRFLHSGFQAVLDYRGNVRFHSAHQSLANIETLIKTKPESWEFVASDIPQWGYQVITAYPKQEAFASGFKAIRDQLIFWIIFLALLIGLIYKQMKGLVYRPLGGDPSIVAAMVHRISTGDLTSDGSTAPPGSLLADMSLMRNNLNSMLQTITKNAEDLKLAASVFSYSHNSIFVTDTQGNIIAANPAFTAITGYRQEEVIGKNPKILKSGLHNDTFYQNMWHQVSTNGHWGGEIWNKQKNGELYAAILNLMAIRGQDGQVAHYMAISTDITKQKQTEQQLRIAATAFESNEGITVTDAQGLILNVNQSFTKITGYTAEEVIGKKPHVLSSDRQDAAFYDAMWERIHTQGGWEGEIWNRHKSGRIYPEWLNITAVTNEDGVVTNYVGTFNDITEYKRLEAITLQAKATAEAAAEAKAAFLANMSHEIRTPMNAIIGFSHLGMTELTPEKLRDYLAKINHSSSNLLGIINDILDFSKIEAGRMELEVAPFSLRQLLTEIREVTELS